MLFIGVVLLRYAVPPAFNMAVLFLVPVSFAAWFLAPFMGWITALLSTLVMLFFDVRHHGDSAATIYWNAVLNLGMFSFFVFVFAEVRALYQREQALSSHDPLTGLLNRRAFTSIVSMENERIKRHHHPLTLAYIDLDNFKLVNDDHGHAAGDALLRNVAQAIKTAMRSTDFVARLGGDEFAILLPETDSAAARAVMEKLQEKLLSAAREVNYPLTFSIGTVTFENGSESPAEMINLADSTMYSVKQRGKNGVAYKIV
jgi:diguanylate cyclase (GGDEF)-like protein